MHVIYKQKPNECFLKFFHIQRTNPKTVNSYPAKIT